MTTAARNRYFCVTCHGRVSPWSNLSLAIRTVGRQKDFINLYTENQIRLRDNPEDPKLVGWCWSCREMVETDMLTEREALRLLLRNVGVDCVAGKSERARLAYLERRLHPDAYAV